MTEGSIPACAGEPRVNARTWTSRTVYPRVCGGTLWGSADVDYALGLSPRVRGNRRRTVRAATQAGSIPACAGEPHLVDAPFHEGGVYPRVCGGTAHPAAARSGRGGLSPRVRGNRRFIGLGPASLGSIPACAGEPGACTPPGPAAAVYPRVCGGTRRRRTAGAPGRGLSPRVRGNRDVPFTIFKGRGSIPACAGEPIAPVGQAPEQRVYPRVCGGTSSVGPFQMWFCGLSPRVRGNLQPEGQRVAVVGSIPACAGEPVIGMVSCVLVGVYPRVCGGTVLGFCGLARAEGLSPRVRGNRYGWCDDGRVHGSIPACAGEPTRMNPNAAFVTVYPRVCGGTPLCAVCSVCSVGLSPRVRGNLWRKPDGAGWHRSIPACAGEPRTGLARICPRRVYPRVCGGTLSGR